MGRLPMVPETAVPGAMQAVYHRVVQGETELATTLQALFASPVVASGLVELDDPGPSQAGLLLRNDFKISRLLGGRIIRGRIKGR